MKMSKEVDLGKERIGRLFLCWQYRLFYHSWLTLCKYGRPYVHRSYTGSGCNGLTGVGISFPIIAEDYIRLCGTCRNGGAPRASILMGQQDIKGAEKILGNCCCALIITALVLTIAVIGFHTPLLYMFGASENTIGYAQSYMIIYAAGTIFVQLTLGMNAFISAQGFSRISMLTVVIGAITNIILDPILIFVFDMGVQGAALATVISQGISSVWVMRFLMGKQTILKLRMSNFRIKAKVLLPSLALGVAPFIMQSTESILVLCFNSSLLKYGGDLAVGAMTILSSVMQFAMLPLSGFTQGAQPIISYNYGANNAYRVKKAFRLLLISCLTYSAILWLLAMVVPNMFAAIFTSDPALTEITVWALRIYMGGCLLFGAQIACQQTFIALGNAKTSAFLAMFRKIIVLIPLIYILPMFIEDKVMAVFLAEPIADILAVLTTVTMFVLFFKKLLRNMDEEHVEEAKQQTQLEEKEA